MIIRRYKESDWKQLRSMIMEQWDEEYACEAVCYEYRDPWYYLDNFLSSEDHIVFVAIKDNELCGYIVLGYCPNSIELIYVYTSINKRRQGISMALIRQAEIHGQVEKKEEIWMNSVVSNDRSHKLKAKLGYVNEMTHYTSRKKL